MARYCPLKQGPALYLDCRECTDHACEKFFCLVVGSRTFTDYQLLTEKLNALLVNHPDTVIISGDARGADALAEKYAGEHELAFIKFPADWKSDPKGAGYKRNKQMHEFVAHFPKRGCVAFWDGVSKGTQQSFKLAEENNNPIRVIRVGK